MFDWLGKALGGDAKGNDGVPAAWARQLESVLDKADKLKGIGRRGLGRDLAGYVLREDPIAVLAEVGKNEALSGLFGLTFHFGNDDTPAQSRRLYAGMGEVPPAIVQRWGRLLEASLGTRASAYWTLKLPAGAQWVEALLLHASSESFNSWSGGEKDKPKLPHEVVEAALVAAGLPANALLVACFATPMTNNWGGARIKHVAAMPGYAAAVARHLEAVRPHVLPDKVEQRLHVLEMLAALDDGGLAAFASELAEHGASSSKQVRAAVEPLARRVAPFLADPLKVIATQGKPDQRLNALRLLHTLAKARNDIDLQGWVRETALADKAPTIVALPSEWEARGEAEVADDDRYEYAIPAVDWLVAMTPELSGQLEQMWSEINASVDKANKAAREHHEKQKAQGNRYNLHQQDNYTRGELEALRDALASGGGVVAPLKDKRRNDWGHVGPALQRFAKHPVASVPAVLKILAAFGMVAAHRGLSGPAIAAIDSLQRATGRPTLLELSKYLDGMQRNGADDVFAAYTSTYGSIARDWNPEAVWPFFAHHLDRLLKLLQPGAAKDYWTDRAALYRAVATLPTPPVAVVNALFDLALGTTKSDRALAQSALHALPGKESRIVNALADGKAEVRTVAAQWLGKLKHAEAIPALEKAVAKEKHDVPKGAMLDALQALGQPVEKYLDREALAAEAAKSLAKGLPKDLDWFPWAAMPAVRWADSGAPVPPDVLRWLMAQAVRQKTPEPNAVLRKYCAMFQPRDREAFGQFVLEAWLAEDVRPISTEEAQKLARDQANLVHGWMKSSPQYYQGSPHLGKSVEELFAFYLPGFLRQPAGTAIGSKGLLAVAAACAAERAPAPVQRYLKEWYGNRAAQGKALIAMLAWIEHPAATQLMLSVGNRFRTKSFQEEATRQAEALAERRGWTLEELADRTMPSAGFDETGELELSYGERVFTARLLPDFKVELFNPDGKKIAALPEPRQDDDADRAKDAKKAFAAAKKEIKSIVELQSDRLYEALCTGRDWAFEDWEGYLNRHPVVRRLVQRLVWGVVEDGKLVATFRPLDDGTLTDNDDNPVAPAPGARVRVAHDSNLPAADVGKWQQHLKDYEVKPLFQQFGKGTWTLPDAQRRETAVMDFEGHLIEAFALRGRANKLGYVRGPTEDGGWFMTYEKRFPTLGLVAQVEFTGNPLPEENRTVALLKLAFVASQGADHGSTELALAEVPPVLLSECYNDLRLIAADGTGFDPDWQKKSEY